MMAWHEGFGMRFMHRCDMHGTHWFDGDEICYMCRMKIEEENRVLQDLLERKTRSGRKWPQDKWAKQESK